jgi:CheY-like chemotaxis protein
MGHTVTLTDNGQIGVDACETTEFDIVPMDVKMPVLDGIAAA